MVNTVQRREIRRIRVIAIAALLAAIGSILALVALSLIHQRQVIKVQRQHVQDYAYWAAMRVERTLNNAKQALARAQKINQTDCSNEHILAMGQVAADAHSVEDVGFFRDNAMACSRLGIANPPIPARPPDLDLGGGYWFAYARQPKLYQGKPRIELRLGNYGVLLIPGRFTDLVGDSEVVLGVVADNGRLVELSRPLDSNLIQALIFGKNIEGRDRYTFVSHSSEGFIAFALIDNENSKFGSAIDWGYIIPLGILISIFLGLIIVWVSKQQLSAKKKLDIAIRKKEFFIHYQPIVELATGRCIAAEALIRWRQQDGYEAPPDQFIPLAEASGLIYPLTDLVISVVMKDMTEFLRQSPDVHISINISASDMESGRFLSGLIAEVVKAKVIPSQIWLEVTERGFMNISAATDSIEAARAAGFRIVIDDFGTGYSSLSILERLSLDALKIDKSFVDAIGLNAASSIVTPHIIEMAHELNLAIVAEGIETSEQEDYLKDANVQYGQGWLYSKALSVSDFIAFCQKRMQ